MTIVMNSPAFRDGDPIPAKYTRDGGNVSPPLEWTDAPEGTQSFVLIVEDSDAPSGTFRHWAVYNIKRDRDRLPENATRGAEIETLGNGLNDFGNAFYDGPQPPKGHGPHRYHFRLAALDVPELDVPDNAKASDIWNKARPHILEEADLVGTYGR